MNNQGNVGRFRADQIGPLNSSGSPEFFRGGALAGADNPRDYSREKQLEDAIVMQRCADAGQQARPHQRRPGSIDCQERAASCLHGAIDQLEKLLDPVMTPCAPECNSTGPRPELPGNSAFLIAVNAGTRAMESAEARLASLIRRLEL